MLPRIETIKQGIVVSDDLLESKGTCVGSGMAVGG